MELTEEQRKAIDCALDMLLCAMRAANWEGDAAYAAGEKARQLLAAHNVGAQEAPVAWQFRERGTEHWVACPKQPTHLADHDFEKRPLYTHPRPMTDAARARPSVVLAYSTKGHNKPCGQTIGANGCGEFVTVYYGDVDAAGRSARDHLGDLEKAGHRFNWALVMRSDEEAYRGPAMTFAEIERLDRAKGA